MMIRRYKYIIPFLLILFLIGACKKSEDRACFKGIGDQITIEVPLDSVRHFVLNKNIRYKIYQDTLNKIVINGGSNMVNFITVGNADHVLNINNENKCRFLRSEEDLVEVEIHYPFYDTFFMDVTDSVIFVDTIVTENLYVEMRDGGGSAKMNVRAYELGFIVSNGAADFTLGGRVTKAELKVQNNGAANTENLIIDEYVFIYQNSTANILLNMNLNKALVVIDGSGDVIHIGNPNILIREGLGTGEIIAL
ncbi:GIN domain-containing protein [Crocinitomix catalasitica]|uniref:GIN domain-containing protein n=1 Tax=Crocinitomix catalasitica TaxID=184607 RepID=UPI0004899D3D|nr:DUF2807 domain-containing protein [Crocinitomix catalasitica]